MVCRKVSAGPWIGVARRSVILQTLCLIFPLILSPVPARAQGAYSIEGRVLLPNGEPPSVSVRVTITHNGMYTAEVFTDLSGRYYIAGLDRGAYVLTAHGDGETFDDTAVRADLGSLPVPETFTVNMELRLKRGKVLPSPATVSAEKFDPAVPEAARKEYLEGLKGTEKGDSKKAIQHFTGALAIYPKFFEAELALADELSKKGDSGRAETEYKKALDLKPDNAGALMGLGIVLVKLKKYDQAIVDLRRSIELDSTQDGAFLFLGMADIQVRRFNQAEKDLLRAVDLNKASVARVYLADIYERAGYYKDAIDQLQAYLKENPHDKSASQIQQAIAKLEEKEKSKKK